MPERKWTREVIRDTDRLRPCSDRGKSPRADSGPFWHRITRRKNQYHSPWNWSPHCEHWRSRCREAGRRGTGGSELGLRHRQLRPRAAGK